MKKSVLLALAALAFAGTSVAQEVTYVEDCSQGILLNKNKDNWFMTLQGGANMMFSRYDINAPIKDRICGNGALFFGKWVTPTFGFRFGADFHMCKGVTTESGTYRKQNATNYINGYYPEKIMGVGPEFDVLINLTNWWCGYRPGRVYNAVLHGGAGAAFNFARRYNDKNEICWDYIHEDHLYANLGLQNNFSLSKHFDLFIDVTYVMYDSNKELRHDAQASIGFNVNFGKTEWNCPVTAVCPTWKYTDAEGDALVARLANAENELNKLRNKIVECEDENEMLRGKLGPCDVATTIYYPIGNATLTNREKQILGSLAEVMKEDTNQKWQLIGWADNFTGTEAVNNNLRNRRVDGVKNYLLGKGVNEGQLEVGINENNAPMCDNMMTAPLGRAVTITKIAK